MVAKALDEVPEEFDKEWNNLAVTVRTDWPTEAEKKRMGVPEGHLVFGTYSGASRTQGFPAADASRQVIVIYQPALELRYGSDKDRLQQEIHRVVLHELAHVVTPGAGHGPEFVAAFLALVRERLGFHAYGALLAELRHRDLMEGGPG